MTHRPKYPKTDAIHKIVSEVLRKLDYQYMGTTFHLIDTSKAGGFLTDYLLIAGGKVHFIEVKIPGEQNNLTSGEQETRSWGVPFYVITSVEEVIEMFQDIVDELVV